MQKINQKLQKLIKNATNRKNCNKSTKNEKIYQKRNNSTTNATTEQKFSKSKIKIQQLHQKSYKLTKHETTDQKIQQVD